MSLVVHARSLVIRVGLVYLPWGVVACSGAASVGGDEAGTSTASGSSSGDDGSDSATLEPGSTGEPEAPDACAEACLDLVTPLGIASCHSCRCKAAFDGWLPSVDELQCANAVPIVTYHAAITGDEYELQLSPPGAIDCANPSLLTSSCRQGSRLGHLVHDDVSIYWICRDPYLDLDGTILFDDMAVVGSNLRTGATCFWDDVNEVVHEDDAPPLDLEAATPDERERFTEVFAYTDGSGCVTCHDHDPFIYTPYLQSTGWQSVAGERGPYHLVTLGPEPRATGASHLVSPAADACTGCHRLGSDRTCSFFAPDALGTHKIAAYEPEVHAATEPSSPQWMLAHWMPDGTQAVSSRAEWEERFGAAREHILGCCEAPGVDVGDCQWEPVPAW